MRELKDYFCTYEQSKAIMSLDCQYRWVVARYENDNDNVLVLLLRSQALDYFRELGWIIIISNTEFDIVKDGKWMTSEDFESTSCVEGALIDKLIELEKEARNGK